MTLPMHKLVVETPALDRSMRMYEEHMREGLLLLSQGAGDAQAICRHGVQFSIWNACILVMLGRSEEEALRWFRQALAYGLMGLAAGIEAGDARLRRPDGGRRRRKPHRLRARASAVTSAANGHDR